MENIEEIGRKCIDLGKDEFQITSCCYDSKIACVVNNQGTIGICTTDHGFDWYNGVVGEFSDTITHINYLRNIDAISVADDNFLLLYDYDKNCILVKVEFNEEQIGAVSWNPMQTVLLVVTKLDTIKLFHLDGKTLSFQREESLDVNSPRATGRPIVFEGQKKSLPSYAPPQISWKDNDTFFVNYLSQYEGRIIKLFNIALTPVIQSDNAWGLESHLTVNSLGQKIATCIVGEEENVLMIFENQCFLLSHFTLPFTSRFIEKMIFHPLDPKMLAIHHIDNDKNNCIDIYVNYLDKWYLKQQLFYPPEMVFRGFDWDGTQDFSLFTIVVFTDRKVIHHTFRSVFSRSLSRASVGIVNGGVFDVCIYKSGIMPPPDYSYRISHQFPINRVIFHPFKHLCILIDSHMDFILVDYYGSLKKTICVESGELYRFHHIDWRNPDELYIFVEGRPTVTAQLTAFNVTVKILCLENFDPEFILPVEVSSYDSKTYVTYAKDIDHIYRMSIVMRDTTVIHFVIGRHRELYINEEFICAGVTSLCQHEFYIFFTHENGRLYCVRTEDLGELTANKKLELLFSSPVGDGVKILVVQPDTVPSILLTVPIGTLEIVNCRLVTVDRLITMIKKDSWKLAIRSVKRARIDPNILIHVNPQQFLDNIDTVIDETDVETFINVVQSFDIKRNLFDTEPKFWDKMVDTGTDLSQTDIIDAILEKLEACPNEMYGIYAVAVIKFRHKSIKDCLEFLCAQFSKDDNAGNRPLLGGIISRLIKLADVKRVVKTAYLLVNINFLEFVFKQTTEDPAYYEQLIRDLSDLSPILRNFTMMRDGGDMAGAVKYMIQYENFSPDDIKLFVEEYSVQQAAYHSVDKYSPRFRLLSELFSNYLSKLNQHSYAGLVLRKAGLHYEAIQEYIKADDYYEVLGLLDSIERSERSKVIQQSAAHLVRSKKIDEAVMLLMHYNNDINQAIEILAQENYYRKALALVKRQNLEFQTGLEVMYKARTYLEDLSVKFKEMDTIIHHHVKRLSEIRKCRRMSAKNSLNSAFDHDEFELASVLSTTSYGSSAGGSTVSSRNRRKLLRKKRDTRQGGKFEDIALIRELYEMFSSIGELGRAIVDICLIPEPEIVQAKVIYKECIDLHKTMIKFSDQIWPDILSTGERTTNEEDLAVILNRDDLEEQYRKPPPELFIEDWYIKLY